MRLARGPEGALWVGIAAEGRGLGTWTIDMEASSDHS